MGAFYIIMGVCLFLRFVFFSFHSIESSGCLGFVLCMCRFLFVLGVLFHVLG